jgi:hypothetical protein
VEGGGDEGEGDVVPLLEEGRCQSRDRRYISSGHSAKFDNIDRSDGSILVVDGLTKADSVVINRSCSAWRRQDKKNRCFVVVSSVSVTVALEQNLEADIETFTVSSWSLKQYQDACSDDELYAQVESKLVLEEGGGVTGLDKEELILCKYRFAGGCARWMFEFSYDKWLTDFSGHLAKIGSYKNIFTEGGGDEAVMAANHLRGVCILETGTGRQQKTYFFVSEYAAMELGKKCDDKRKFLISSYKKADEAKNPSFRGWIFEFDVDYQLEEACKTKKALNVTIRLPKALEQWKVAKYITFSAVSFLVAEIKQLDIGATLWAKPEKWNQAAYEFLCFRNEGGALHMTAVNATSGEKHRVLLGVVNLLGQELGTSGCVIKAIRFDFVVPKNAAFQIGDVSGNLVGWKNHEGTPWAQQSADWTNFIVVADLDPTVEG